jgi:hypothetical protein
VLDQTGDVVLVLDDKDSVPGHKWTSAAAEGTGRFVGGAVISAYREPPSPPSVTSVVALHS